MGCWGYQGNGSKLTDVLPIMLSCELRVLFSPALLLAGGGIGKVWHSTVVLKLLYCFIIFSYVGSTGGMW